RIDLVRTVRDERYHYIRNYIPHRIYGQHIDYMFQTPTTRAWKQLYDEGQLRPPKTFFWEPKPAEELYDMASDPHEVRNLANSPEHQTRLKRFRKALMDFVIETHDLGFLPEAELHSRSTGSTPYELGRNDKMYPLRHVFETADLASMLKTEDLPRLKKALSDTDSAVRYWAASGLLMRGRNAVEAALDELRNALSDASPSVRIVAAEALGKFGNEADLKRSLAALMELAPMDRNGVYIAVQALNALDELDTRAAGVKDAIKALPTSAPGVPQKLSEYVPRLIEKTLADL
ncbi:MAG TPA: HEAT repeat domain-containing protein, partial [Verrucomicrobiae bacterium]|nr:HEAT repeat domain-containing protein [Verrucomicrobiae bacterium]